MKPVVSTITLALVLLWSPWLSVAGEWRHDPVETTTKNVRGETVWTVNESGHRLTFLRGQTGPVYAVFRLAASTPDEFGTREPRYRVDDGPLRLLADYGQFLDMSSKTAQWPVWDGPQPPCAVADTTRWREMALCEIFRGHRIEFQFWLVTGERRNTVFSLTGARTAIEKHLFR